MANSSEILFRLALAAALGALVGLEREVHGRPAGIRTYLLLSMGSALIMVLSEFLFLEFVPLGVGEAMRADPGRIAAQAVTGIGFLGGGVILRYRDSIRGLTTAACVWVACAIGLTIGAGFYLFGTAVTALTLVSLVGLKAVEKRLKKDWYKEMIVISQDEAGQVKRIQEFITQNAFEIVNFNLRRNHEQKEFRAKFLLRMHAVQPSREVLHEVFALEGVKSVELNF
ncbi:MAG: MgtC/SapB family protein [Desulfobaccales bacterium]|jgi:putative Mg2+ transporter-C (MgtC) family protein